MFARENKNCTFIVVDNVNPDEKKINVVQTDMKIKKKKR